MTPEDQDCDGHIDIYEDRNHNRMLDDRPFPEPSDGIFLHEVESPCDVLHRLPPQYLYPTFTPRVTFRADDAGVDRAW